MTKVKIPLKTDVEKPNYINLKEDLSIVRDNLVTLLREYHIQGKDKYDETVEKALETRKEVESVKNDSAAFEARLNSFDTSLKEAEILVNKTVTKLNVFASQINSRMLQIESDYKKIQEAFGEDFNAEDNNIATLAIRVSKVIKEVEELKKKKRKKFLGIF